MQEHRFSIKWHKKCSVLRESQLGQSSNTYQAPFLHESRILPCLWISDEFGNMSSHTRSSTEFRCQWISAGVRTPCNLQTDKNVFYRREGSSGCGLLLHLWQWHDYGLISISAIIWVIFEEITAKGWMHLWRKGVQLTTCTAHCSPRVFWWHPKASEQVPSKLSNVVSS